VTPNPQSLGSNNPFERSVSNPVPQQQPQSTTTSYNPFDQLNPTPTSAQPLEASFQNLQVSQPLFPHSTGGFPNQAQPQATYQPSFAPSATLGQNQGGYVSSPQAMDSNYNPFFQTTPQPQGGVASQQFSNPGVAQNNPFFNAPQNYAQPQQSAAAPTLAAPRPPQHANTMPAVSSSSPFGTSPFGSTPFQTQQQPQQNQNVSQGSYNPFQQAMPTPQSAGPFTTQPQFPPQQVQQQQQPQQQQLVPQTTGQMNKNGILSLYNLAPSPAVPQIPNQFQQQQPQAQYQPQAQPQAQPFNGMATSPIPPLTNSLTTTPQTQPGSAIPTPQPTTAGPMASRNPFGAATVGSGLAAQAGVTPSQLNQPSSGLGIGMGTNGGAAAPGAPGMKPSTSPFSSSSPFSSTPFSSSPFSGPPPTSMNMNSTFPRTHMSQPSVDVNGLQNGRHSPDAFASLSARYG
jgi:hypothetical protein